MRFSDQDRSTLLAIKGIGPKVIERLEQMGISRMDQLAAADAADLLAHGTSVSGTEMHQ